MHAISLNICAGGGDRAPALLQWLAERSPDLIALPEWRDNAPGAALKAGLEARGFQTATATTNGANGVLLAAKRPFSSRCATPPMRERKRSEGRGGALLVARFRDEHGEKAIDIPPKVIQIILSNKSPGVARNWYKHIRSLCQFAVTVGMIDVDPTQSIKRPKCKTERRRPWTDAEVAQFERAHPVGSKARLAFALGLYTVQRLGDVAVMGRQHIHKGRLEIRQSKTGNAVSVPVRAELQTIIDAARSGMTFLLKDSGKPFASGELSTQFRRWPNEAGLPAGCTFHGLRATGCTIFADAGCSAHEIAACSGHKSLAEVERYTRSANQKKLADQLARAAQA